MATIQNLDASWKNSDRQNSRALAAEAVASRLERQEEDIRWLWAEVQRLRDEQLNAPDRCPVEGPCLTREVAQLRAENRDLRHRLSRLRLCLAEELSQQAKLESAARAAAAQEEAGRAAAGAQPPSSQSQEKSTKMKEEEGGPESEVKNQPNFIKERLKLFEILKRDHQLLFAINDRKGNTSNVITVRVADGKTVEGEVWKTTPYQVAAEISQELAESAVVAKVNGELWDLDRPLEGDSTLELLMFDNEEAQAVYWHSSAHILGEAMELYYGGHLCYGPPIENGFYYDMFIEDRAVSSTELSALENICKTIIKEKQPFERLEVSKEVLLEMFEKIWYQKNPPQSIYFPWSHSYRCGPLIDLCKGPHVRHTGKIKAIKIFKNSSTYWEGNPEMETLQRIYGISFPDNKMMKTWEKFQEEARNRDHRKIGKEQELFFFHDLSPGSCFFLPRGAFIYNTLMDFIREEYHQRNFTEVLSPNMYNSRLWETSGHWQHYSENMFTFDIEKDTFALKPMNCPGHCLMFAHRPRSWREMPIRFADFGVLHRNELSGTLSGLTRVRRFQQDDAHIFCTVEQIEEEIKGCLKFLQSVYSTFGFSFQLNLSTRPENFLGEVEIWDEAEKQLQNSLVEFGKPWKMNPGDGAFYGPKIDIKIKDAIGRYHQCATIQLDFQLPMRFNLTYVSKDGDDKKNPVIIHRAILGSVERMIAILSENYGGKWPFWLSPRQVMVIPVGPTCENYALQVSNAFFEEGFMADVDLDHSCTLNKKIRNAQLAQYNFILVVGEKEKTNNAVNVRTRDNKIHGEISVTSAIDKLKTLKKSRTLNAEEEF
ncbi:probable threonyl-trna synthetase [Lynx pardinus]|uniref:threonine--tRNA ligase n=2 Tax=Lynx pardinus TaxID=191816 RepID=A0A485P2G3_LYNPA|nr:probable threonyl-trna synthetase [Lynx pardinus]